MDEQTVRLKLRSIRLDDGLWERVTLAARVQDRSASQLVAAAVRAYVSGPQERPGAPPPSSDPPAAPRAAPAPAQPVSRPVPVAAVQPRRRVPAGDEPRPLTRPDVCAHPAAARRGGMSVVRHCADCGRVFGLTGLVG